MPKNTDPLDLAYIAIGAASYSSLKSILKNGLDKKRVVSTPAQTCLPFEHANLRGPGYFH